MDNRILLISSGSTFMIDALSKNLKDAGLEVVKCEPVVDELDKYRDGPDVFLFYLGGFVDEIPDVLIYLRDICLEKNKILCMIGDEAEYEVVGATLTADSIAEKFDRPVDMKLVSERMRDLCKLNNEMAKRRNILLVDDDPTFLKLAKNWLEEKYRVTIVSSGTQAITYLATNMPDLILLDYEMPVTPGPLVLEMIRSDERLYDTPIIFLTGKGDRESVMKVVGLKPNGYLLKNMPKNELLKSIEEFFDGTNKLN
ncbi:Response regulator receiver domain-containing protein [Butyrivibrio sp. ob235]|uniref:response regulator n=1 Tax=Butyrivibrio sp. ob235 TaxID=1761780 RepID=UPI0008CFDC27|nr:response regulator [Butyrivibrio sp. ob235]SEM40769.1 Response regulator receiver domain-containing protein [Butyrivibrio sp. ob235]